MWLFYVVPVVASAYFTYRDASKQKTLALNIPPIFWAIFCVPSGVLGLIAYWVMNHSSLAKNKQHE